MVWAIVVVAIAVLGVAAWAGTGKLGEMPGTVIDRPKAHVPEGPVDEGFVANLSLPTAGTGYQRSQVDALLAAHVSGEDIEPGTRFDVVRRGYDMQAVDAVIERIGVHEYRGASADAPDADGIVTASKESSVVGEDATITRETGQSPLSGELASEENSDEAFTGEENLHPSEGMKRAFRED